MNRIFQGAGVTMLSDALEMAKQTLQTDNPDTHPDFLFVSPGEGKGSICIEDIAPVVEKALNPPSIARKGFVLIDHAETMNADAQNRLLKSLEESDYIDVCFVAYDDTLLPTIKSRCCLSEYRALTLNAYAGRFSGIAADDLLLLYYAGEGSETLTEELLAYLPVYRSIYQTVASGRKLTELLPILHLVKEKDKEAASGKTFWYSVLCVLERCYLIRAMESGDTRALHLVMENKRSVTRQWYTAGNFFDLLIMLIETK